MKRPKYIWLVIHAFYEMARYEAIFRLRGSGRILQHAARQSIVPKAGCNGLEEAICNAVLLATCFYWKPVLCLQRAVCTARLLKKHGIPARLVIAYRPSPFFSHAWVEVDGRVVYGSPAYQKRLLPLYVG